MVFLFEGIQACANANASDSQVRPLSELTVRIYIIEQYVIKLVWVQLSFVIAGKQMHPRCAPARV